jgi:hypothetical protein
VRTHFSKLVHFAHAISLPALKTSSLPVLEHSQELAYQWFLSQDDLLPNELLDLLSNE